MKPCYCGVELRKEYHALRLTLSPKEACEAIADRLLDDVERVRFSICYAQKERICRTCWIEYNHKGTYSLKSIHRCPPCLREYINKASREMDARNRAGHIAGRIKVQFYTNDELFHELVKVRHVYTAAEFGEALQDVKVFPHGLHQ